jgi:hypothetical protein
MADPRVRAVGCGRLALLVCGLLAAGLPAGGACAGTQEPATGGSDRSGGTPAGLLPEQSRIINEHVAAKWKSEGVTPSPRCDDYTFIRRASLDVIGRIARPEELTRFFSDPPATRRALLIDRLLKSEDYVRHWANVWTVWLLTRSAHPTYAGQMQRWLEERFDKDDCAWDKIVAELLTATGKTTENGAVNFVLAHLGEPTPMADVARDGQFNMVPVTSRTTRLFLGLQTQCTQCHDHPFKSQWKQKHFWMTNAFFRQVERKGNPNVNRRQMGMEAPELALLDNPGWNHDDYDDVRPGLAMYEKRNGVVLGVQPAFLLDEATKKNPPPHGQRRRALADYVVKSEQFPKAYVNRMWAHFFGRGMNAPGAFDDFGEDNPVTHPELLDYLAGEFRNYGFNPRALIRWVCNSDAYGLSSQASRSNKAEADPFFSRMLLKSMSPEQLFESLLIATQAESAKTKDAKDQLRDRWLKNLIVNFGDDEGNEVTFNGTVVQALLLMNGKEIDEAIAKSPLFSPAKKNGGARQLMDSIFLAVLNRPMTSSEAGDLPKKLRPRGLERDAHAPYHDLMWALINSNEFILNH